MTDESYGVNTARFAEGNWSVDRALMVNLFSQVLDDLEHRGLRGGGGRRHPRAHRRLRHDGHLHLPARHPEVTSANIVAMIVAMLGVYLCKALGLTGPAILIGAVPVSCAPWRSRRCSRAVPSRQALPVLIP